MKTGVYMRAASGVDVSQAAFSKTLRLR